MRTIAPVAIAREQRQQRADYERNLSIIRAAVAVSPDLLERLAMLEQTVRDQGARIAALEARPADDEDGRPRSQGEWCKTAEAMLLTGYSRSGLRKLRQQNRIVFDFAGPHCLYDVTSIVRKVRSKVPA